jgi:hypothetical protein
MVVPGYVGLELDQDGTNYCPRRITAVGGLVFGSYRGSDWQFTFISTYIEDSQLYQISSRTSARASALPLFLLDNGGAETLKGVLFLADNKGISTFTLCKLGGSGGSG